MFMTLFRVVTYKGIYNTDNSIMSILFLHLSNKNNII